jgi:hypothetical protein
VTTGCAASLSYCRSGRPADQRPLMLTLIFEQIQQHRYHPTVADVIGMRSAFGVCWSRPFPVDLKALADT